ncbi:MAG: phosphatase PAP2 family protein [Archangium sp.]|nr:phosphatase PAP2 family protein [Archangium sp.]
MFLGWLIVGLRRKALLPVAQVAAAIGVADGLGSRVLKPWFGRMRPSYALAEPLVRVLSPAANVGSMPSLHSANAFAMATVVTFAIPRAGFVAIPLATLIALSRVGVGVHWPSDVIAGALYGAGVGAAIVLVSRRLVKKLGRPA